MPSADLIKALKTALPPACILEGDILANRPAGVGRSDTIQAPILLRPATTEEVSMVLRICHAHGQAVVTHGGLSGITHATDTTPDDVVLSLERMRAIISIDATQRVAVVEAGATLQQVQEAADAGGLLFPLDLGGRGSATLGGNAATNAGGNRVIRYGMARDMILGLEVVLADGTVIPSMNRMIKNNAGYDLKHLFIGSEGTLGVITKLVLRLREKLTRQDVALVAVPGFGAMTQLLRHMDSALGGGLSAFEVMWPEFYRLVTRPPAKGRAPLRDGYPLYVLIEAFSKDAAADAERFNAALEQALDQGLVADAVIAKSQEEVEALWALRDDVGQIMQFGKPFCFDVSLPIAAMENYVQSITKSIAGRWAEHHLWVFGHVGDGNLHVGVHVLDESDAVRRAVEEIVYRPLQAVGGSVSAEHGIGLEKKGWLHLSRSPQEIALMRTLKSALDPKGILNPGRIF
jgi:FAD/FMN-containing dehydrogenase